MELSLPENALDRINKRITMSSMCAWLNMTATLEDDQLRFHLGFGEAHIGNPIIRAIHGGVVSTFLETASYLETFARLPDTARIQTTSVHTSYLRSTKAIDMHASVTIHRLGRRFGFLEATCWQTDSATPVAFAETGIRIMRSGE